MKNKKTSSNNQYLEDNSSIQGSQYLRVDKGSAEDFDGEIVSEALACISVNGKELASFMCSPSDLDMLAVGFLFNENLIQSMDDIKTLHVSDNNCVDIWLGTDFQPPERLIVTAGCGGGITFDDLSKQHAPINSELNASHEKVSEIMREVHLGASLYHKVRGIHTAALTDHQSILIQVEDLGRHNCIDKLAGAAMMKGIETKDKMLFSSGRISSEMINKARRLSIPIVCSRTSPTSLSVELAQQWNMTLIGYLRQKKMRIYSHPERITFKREPVHD